jgi:hypothetical protein
MRAIALAAVLGASQIIVTGMDMFNGGKMYFHDRGAKPEKRHLPKAAMKRRAKERVRPLVAFCAGAHVRPMSGPLTEWFKTYDPAETPKPARPVGYRLRLEEEAHEVLCEVTHPFRMTNDDYTTVGDKLALSKFEFEKIGCGLRRLATPVSS